MTTFGFYSEEEGKQLLQIARASIEEQFSNNFDKQIKELKEKKQFKQLRGVFVTLHKNNNLRGCIGFPYPDYPIFEAIYKAAKQSSFSDPRFPKLKQEELKDIKIEISVLTYPEPIKDTKEIEIGKHGLTCDYLGYSGLLLPQVAKENNFSKIEFLECLCEKSNLPKDTWQNKNFKLQKFEAQIFREE
jgi:uncharacterized protein